MKVVLKTVKSKWVIIALHNQLYAIPSVAMVWFVEEKNVTIQIFKMEMVVSKIVQLKSIHTVIQNQVYVVNWVFTLYKAMEIVITYIFYLGFFYHVE